MGHSYELDDVQKDLIQTVQNKAEAERKFELEMSDISLRVQGEWGDREYRAYERYRNAVTARKYAVKALHEYNKWKHGNNPWYKIPVNPYKKPVFEPEPELEWVPRKRITKRKIFDVNN